jgi:hypothetical protein
MQNAIFNIEMASSCKGTSIKVYAYNLEDAISGKLLWMLSHSLIGNSGRCYVEIYNYSGNEFICAERYILKDVVLSLNRDKRTVPASPQFFTLEGVVEQEVNE